MSFEFLLTSLVVVLLPGTGVLYTLAVGLGLGLRASAAAAVGCTFGIVPAAAASIIGLSAIFHTSALAFQILKILGTLYLFYMAWSILRDGGALDVKGESKPRSLRQIAVSGCLLNVLNPKLSLFFLAFLPQFISPTGAAPVAQMTVLALIFMLLTLLTFLAYGAFAAAARDYVITKPNVMRWMKRAFAGSFALLGARLALSDR